MPVYLHQERTVIITYFDLMIRIFRFDGGCYRDYPSAQAGTPPT